MKEDQPTAGGKPDRFWRKVYFSVVLTTIVVIAALWSFSNYFR